MQKRYRDYELTDFLADESFKNWVKQGKPDTETWAKLMSEDGPQREIIKEAEAIILFLSPSKSSRIESKQKETWHSIEQRISFAEANKSRSVIKKLYFAMNRYAAVLLLLVASFGVLVWLYWGGRKVEFQTGNGEQLTITLPDQSTVTLAANSSLSFYQTWQSNKAREVWVDGEAHFDVKHINRDQRRIEPGHRFVAHLNNVLHVEVLGTIFNVKNRRKQMEVELVSGSVHVSDANASMRLKPGETVSRLQHAGLTKSEINSGLTHNWADRELIMNQADMNAVLMVIEDTFGKQIKAEGFSLAGKKLDGALPLINEQETLAVLGAILEASVELQGNSVVLKSATH